MADELSVKQLIDELKTLGENPDHILFACGGSIEFDKPIRLHYSKKKSSDTDEDEAVASFQFPPEPNTFRDKMDELVDACDAQDSSSNGHDGGDDGGGGGDGDANSDNGALYSMDSERWSTSFQLSELNILDQIHRTLNPFTSGVRAYPYKLSVVKDGWQFDPIGDTAVVDDIYGVLVVCLPTSCTGGKFEVKNGETKQEFLWDTMSDQTSRSKPAVQWCAFGSDCSYRVGVESGFFVTLTYVFQMYRGVKPVELDMKNNAFVEKLGKLVQRMKVGGTGETLGFALEHKYTVGYEGDVPMLKGFDRFVKAALDELGLEYEFRPFFLAMPKPSESEGDNCFAIRLLDGAPSVVKADNFEVYVSSWSTIMDRSGYSENYDVDGTMLEHSVLEVDKVEGMHWIIPPTSLNVRKLVGSYGNDISTEHYYAAAAFFVKL